MYSIVWNTKIFQASFVPTPALIVRDVEHAKISAMNYLVLTLHVAHFVK